MDGRRGRGQCGGQPQLWPTAVGKGWMFVETMIWFPSTVKMCRLCTISYGTLVSHSFEAKPWVMQAVSDPYPMRVWCSWVRVQWPNLAPAVYLWSALFIFLFLDAGGSAAHQKSNSYALATTAHHVTDSHTSHCLHHCRSLPCINDKEAHLHPYIGTAPCAISSCLSLLS